MRDSRSRYENRHPSHWSATVLLVIAGLMHLLLTERVAAQTVAISAQEDTIALDTARLTGFREHVKPFLSKYCVACHNVDEMSSGVRVDNLDGALQDRQLRLWEHVRTQLDESKMPPKDELQPSADERQHMIEWIDQTVTEARSRPAPKDGAVRRLTVAQFRNTLRDLLGIDDDLTEILPPDSITRDGFANNSDTLELSPLMIETYFDIADHALERCLVDEASRPAIQNFRMDLGRKINLEPCPDQLILGANNLLLANADFTVTQLTAKKPFAFDPFFMQTKYRFIEGYQGNDTVRGWREYDSIYHSVFACMRGTEGYPKGLPYETVPTGLLLRPAIPSAEVFEVESTYGPKANFKISLRELPDQGRFRVAVRAAKYDDGLLLDAGAASQPEPTDGAVTVRDLTQPQTVRIEHPGIYQADVRLTAAEPESQLVQPPPTEIQQPLTLTLNDREFSGTLLQDAFVIVRLPAGQLRVATQYAGTATIDRVVLTPLGAGDAMAQRFTAFQARSPHLGVHLGLRRDCGSTFSRVGRVQNVKSTEPADFVFEGAIRNFPSPDVEKENVNYLAGIREIGVRSEFTDGRDMPRLLIQSVEFEGPLYDAWPPAPHRSIFIESPHRDDPPTYAREIIRSFASRAFRRPITAGEEESLFAVWDKSFKDSGHFRESIRDTLLVVLTSPQFLFSIENSASPAAEPLTPYELASKLSYFLWNTAPDQRLLDLAATGRLHESLDAETTRLITDPRFRQFTQEFVSQWLGLRALDVVEIDRKRFPKLTRDVRSELRHEPVEFVQYLIRHNVPLRNLIESRMIVANEVVADYYGLGAATESGFEFVPITHNDQHLGGVLTEAAILAGLSNGREPNPVKRGAWFARKIIAMPPDDPPPNVPALPEADAENLSLRQKLERHRNQPGCAKCHSGIDPWGVPFESYDAAGLFRNDETADTRSTLPDSTEVADVNALRKYLVNERLNQVAFSYLKHLSCYAAGRDLTWNEVEFLRKAIVEWADKDFALQDMTRFVIQSPIFLEK